MSRSYKKSPVVTLRNNATRFFKRLANKRVRRTIDLEAGTAYKKVSNSYDICDWTSRVTLEEFLRTYKDNSYYDFLTSDKEAADYWKKEFISK